MTAVFLKNRRLQFVKTNTLFLKTIRKIPLFNQYHNEERCELSFSRKFLSPIL